MLGTSSVRVLKDAASAVPPAKLTMSNKAVVDACDAQDGMKDGLLNNPRACRFDPATLLCKGSDGDNCLTAPQLESVKRLYAPAKTKGRESIFPGKDPGSETEWNLIAGGPQPPGVSVGSFPSMNDAANFVCKAP